MRHIQTISTPAKAQFGEILQGIGLLTSVLTLVTQLEDLLGKSLLSKDPS